MATLDDVRRAALALPETTEELTWETDITFRVRHKIFAIGGQGSSKVTIKATPSAQSDLIDRDPVTFGVAAYVGRFGWITVDLDRVDQEELGAILAAAWRLTAPKQLAATITAPEGSPTVG